MSYISFIEKGHLIAYVIPVFVITIIVVSLVTYFKDSLKGKDWVKNLHILLFYDIATLTIMYPIVDSEHFQIATICTLITIIYLAYIFIKYLLNKTNKDFTLWWQKFLRDIAILLFLVYIIKSMYSLVTYITLEKEKNYLDHFEYIEVNESLYNIMTNINNYIENKENEGQMVLILDTMAAALNIPRDKYYKDYDMLNLGNFGQKGEERNNRRYKRKRKYFIFSKEV